MQSSFTDLEYAAKKKLTRRDRFLAEIDAVTPWAALVAELEPFYPKGKGRGRPPIGLERMLRLVHVEQIDIKSIKREDIEVIEYLKSQDPEMFKTLKKAARAHAKKAA